VQYVRHNQLLVNIHLQSEQPSKNGHTLKVNSDNEVSIYQK
jgi:hypothetical protein